MATTEAVTGLLSESEDAKEPRKAVIASTVGTTIEWHDFLLCSLVAALVFDPDKPPSERR
jgi:hypothetical protein